MSVGSVHLGLGGSRPAQSLPERVDWATGRTPSSSRLDTDMPCWHHSGQPVSQSYQVTQLKRSDVRPDDQLLPKPQECVMHPLMYPGYFPTENPYSSHIPRKAVFPNYDTAHDPLRQRGVGQPLTKQPQMPASAHPIIVASKARDNDYRREIMDILPESRKQPLQWPEDFDQVFKTPSTSHGPIYPVPPKSLVPNVEPGNDRKSLQGNMTLSARTANVTRNLERLSHVTTHQLSHTGHGSAFPLALDNMDEQRARLHHGLEQNTVLRQRGNAIFLPARPQDGRWSCLGAQRMNGVNDNVLPSPEPPRSPRKMTHNEYEEYRLLNGKEYVNLPARPADDNGLSGNHTSSAAPCARHQSVTCQVCTRSNSLPTQQHYIDEADTNIYHGNLLPVTPRLRPLSLPPPPPGTDITQLSIIANDVAKRQRLLADDSSRAHSAPIGNNVFPAMAQGQGHTMNISAYDPNENTKPWRVQYIKDYFSSLPAADTRQAWERGNSYEEDDSVVITAGSTECPVWNLSAKDNLWPRWWYPGCGDARPSSALTSIQDGFSKTQAYRRLNRYTEKAPDLRDNITEGKKHVFIAGFNGQVLRGNGALAAG